MTIHMRPIPEILAAIEQLRPLDVAVPREEVLPLLLKATGRRYRASAMKRKRAIRARAPNGVRIFVVWLWDIAYLHIIVPPHARSEPTFCSMKDDRAPTLGTAA
jgi:hypothetical protein